MKNERGFSRVGNTWITERSIMYFEPDQCLNDEVVIGCSSLLSSMFPLASVTIFRPHLYTNFVEDCQNEAIWKAVQKTTFWSTDVWIVPIHLENDGHWMIATLYIQERRIDLFDSIGLNSSIQIITKVGVCLVCRCNDLFLDCFRI